MKNKTLIITLLTIFLGAFQATWAVAEQIPPECAASYAQYEAKIKNISSEVVPKIFLYYSVANSLDKAYLPSSLEEAKNAPLEALCYYNKLRELYRKTPITSLSQLDPEWLEKTELSIWKERAQEPKESATGFPKQPQKTKETAQVKEEKQPKEQYFDELFEFVITSLDELKYDKSNTALKAEVLRFYNILRKALGQSEARRFTHIDQAWLASQDYPIWKASFMSALSSPGNAFNTLFYSLDRWLSALHENPGDRLLERVALNAYNYLRELYNRPFIASLDELDEQWFRQKAREFAYEKLAQSTLAQKRLVREAQKRLGLKKDILVKSSGRSEDARASWSPYARELPVLIMGTEPDLDTRLFSTYHELGHIAHNDGVNEFLIEDGEKTFQGIMTDPEFKYDVNRIEYYKELGKKAFDESTRIGKRINTILNQYDTFWVKPLSGKIRPHVQYELDKERRADLFALDKFYGLKKITTILNMIYRHASGTRRSFYLKGGEHPIVLDTAKYPELNHPADFERALYMAGFLVDKGIDINAAFREWENRGVCIDAEKHFAGQKSHSFKQLFE